MRGRTNACLRHVGKAPVWTGRLHIYRITGIPCTEKGVITYCFWWKSERRMSAKPEVELIFTIAPLKNSFNVKYL